MWGFPLPLRLSVGYSCPERATSVPTAVFDKALQRWQMRDELILALASRCDMCRHKEMALIRVSYLRNWSIFIDMMLHGKCSLSLTIVVSGQQQLPERCFPRMQSGHGL